MAGASATVRLTTPDDPARFMPHPGVRLSMTTTARRWAVVTPAALALLAAVELAAYLLLGPATPAGARAGALAAAVVSGAAVGLVAAARSSPQFVWLPAAALALVGVAGTAVGPQVLVVALLLVLAALLEEATPDASHPRRDGTGPAPGGRPSGAGPDGDAPAGPQSAGDVLPSRRPGAESPRPPDVEPSGPPTGTPVTTAEGVERVGAGGPDRETVLAAGLLVPLAALVAVSAVTAPVARVVAAATAAVVLGGAGASVAVAARN